MTMPLRPSHTLACAMTALLLAACAPAPSSNSSSSTDTGSDTQSQGALSTASTQDNPPTTKPVSATPLPGLGGAALPSSTLPTLAAKSNSKQVVVYKSPTCGCCKGWVEHMRKEGFEVEVHDHDNVPQIKEAFGIPMSKGSCHTSQVGGYFIEGHVPADAVKKLLKEKPAGKGLVLPGMPAGSPGMETPDGRKDPYVVELVDEKGNTSEFLKKP